MSHSLQATESRIDRIEASLDDATSRKEKVIDLLSAMGRSDSITPSLVRDLLRWVNSAYTVTDANAGMRVIAEERVISEQFVWDKASPEVIREIIEDCFHFADEAANRRLSELSGSLPRDYDL